MQLSLFLAVPANVSFVGKAELGIFLQKFVPVKIELYFHHLHDLSECGFRAEGYVCWEASQKALPAQEAT